MGNRKKVDKQIGKSFGKIIWKRLTRNRLGMLGLAILCVLILLAVLAPWLFPEGYDAQDYGARFIAPCWEHLCGTDNLGRDIFVRIAYGARVSMVIGLVSTSVSLLFGVSLGAIAGYVGGKNRFYYYACSGSGYVYSTVADGYYSVSCTGNWNFQLYVGSGHY